MVLYLVQLFMVFLLSKFGQCRINGKSSAETQKKILIISFILLALPMCLRSYNVGTDTYAYSSIYESIARKRTIIEAFKVKKLSAPIYVIYSYILSRLFTFRQAIILTTSLIICYMMYISIKKSSKNYAQSVLLFVLLTLYYEAFNGARQMLSVVFALYAFLILVDDLRSLKGWTIYLISIGIHNIAIFFIFAIIGIRLGEKSKNNKRLLVTSALLTVISTLFFKGGINLVVRYLPRYVMYINGANPESILVDTGGGRIAFFYLLELAVIVSYVIFSIANKKNDKKYSENKVIPALVFCCICGIVFARNTLIQRLLWYYEALFVTAIPNMLLTLKKRKRTLVWIIMISGLFVYTIRFLVENKGNIIPYYFFWNT